MAPASTQLVGIATGNVYMATASGPVAKFPRVPARLWRSFWKISNLAPPVKTQCASTKKL
ncbi:hypothetical protein PFICI_06483 [Pestalotiopsis fici W106-1]|uniref:Uncharacterized protein n=1 Tax=Pestalotiopsis fici (strain W106-1 / CGMCC3.15140) TaxID=1229662 RepID=W3X8G5_PESFW|nr:uncharacterized protein PFICI_06483 [Pestalotiopsis fici W106-1]ETS81481.1 hypothetical protein PFICI_06483 [Pestalotiopsis fici W106-1]